MPRLLWIDDLRPSGYESDGQEIYQFDSWIFELEQAGFAVETAKYADIAYEEHKHHIGDFDVILIDLMLAVWGDSALFRPELTNDGLETGIVLAERLIEAGAQSQHTAILSNTLGERRAKIAVAGRIPGATFMSKVNVQTPLHFVASVQKLTRAV